MSIPNLITLGRVIFIPIIFWLLVSGQTRGAVLLFVLAGITDAGLIQALDINPEQAESKWQYRYRPSPTSSVLATAGGLVFGGDAAREIKAWDQETGEVLWSQRLNAPVGGYPMTYALDGEQYLVIPTGYSNSASSIAREPR